MNREGLYREVETEAEIIGEDWSFKEAKKILSWLEESASPARFDLSGRHLCQDATKRTNTKKRVEKLRKNCKNFTWNVFKSHYLIAHVSDY